MAKSKRSLLLVMVGLIALFGGMSREANAQDQDCNLSFIFHQSQSIAYYCIDGCMNMLQSRLDANAIQCYFQPQLCMDWYSQCYFYCAAGAYASVWDLSGCE